MKRFFITGAQGFIGRHVVSHLLSSDDTAEVLGAGRSPRLSRVFTHSAGWGSRRISAPLPDGVRASLETGRYRYMSLDLCQRSELARALREFQPEVVIHLASALCDDPPSSLLATNVRGTKNLMEALGASGLSFRKVVLCSTGGVYGIPEELPIREDALCNPIDLYSTSKLTAEHLSRVLARWHRIPALWIRPFNLVGPGQSERHICGKLAAQAAAIAGGVAPPVVQVGALETTRDFIDVRDMASALLIIAEKGEPGRTYNAGSGNESPMHGVLRMTLQLAGLAASTRIEQKNFRVADVPRHFACVERLRSLGFGCRYGLAESIRDLLDYYRHTVKAAAEAAEESESLQQFG